MGRGEGWEHIHVSAISFLTQLTFLTRHDKGSVDDKETSEDERTEQEHTESSQPGRSHSAVTSVTCPTARVSSLRVKGQVGLKILPGNISWQD